MTEREHSRPAVINAQFAEGVRLRKENERLKNRIRELQAALEALINEPQPTGIDRPAYQRALRVIADGGVW